MEWTAAARRVYKTPSKRLSARIRLFTPFCLPTKKDTETAEGMAEGTGAGAEWEAVDIIDIRRNRVPMGKKFSNKYREKQAGVFLKFPKNRASMRFTLRWMKNSAINMAWDMYRTRRTLRRDITRFTSP